MAWHGSSKTPGGKVVLTDKQQAVLNQLAKVSEYWQTASSFIKGVRGRELLSLSEKQLDWYDQIEAGLDVEINRQEARIAFGMEKESD